jgi:glutathione synthase/RimK-type ligase-like ATP-grasp enzyme
MAQLNAPNMKIMPHEGESYTRANLTRARSPSRCVCQRRCRSLASRLTKAIGDVVVAVGFLGLGSNRRCASRLDFDVVGEVDLRMSDVAGAGLTGH